MKDLLAFEDIRRNQVYQGIVRKPENYIFSNVNAYAGLCSIIDIVIVTTNG